MKPSTITNQQIFPRGFANIPMYLAIIRVDFRASKYLKFSKSKERKNKDIVQFCEFYTFFSLQ